MQGLTRKAESSGHFREGKTYPDMQTKSDLPKRHMAEK